MKVTAILEKTAKDALVKAGVQLLDKDPEESLGKLFTLVKKTVKNDEGSLAKVVRVEELYKTNSAIHNLAISIVKDSNKNCIDKFFTNFFANAAWYGVPKRGKLFQETGIKTPFAILMSPSMRCNLRCTGCYASSYSKEDDIPKEEVDRIIGAP